MADNTQQVLPANSDVGDGSVGGTVSTKTQTQLVTEEMAADELSMWWKRIEKAEARIRARETAWDTLLDEYMPIVSKSGAAETVKVQEHFRNVHSKIGNLFYRSPDLIMTPDDPGPANNTIPNPMPPQPGMPPPEPLKMEDVIAIKQAVLKKKLGRDGIKAGRLMDELLFDILSNSGIGVCKVGYKCTFKAIQQPKMGPPVMPQQPGAILNLSQPPQQAPMVPQMDPMTGQPMMETVNVPVHESWYARRVSPKKYLCNHDLYSTRYEEDSTWQGHIFFISQKQAMKDFQLTEQEAQKATEDDRRHKYTEDQQGSESSGLVKCYEIYCKSSFFTEEVHPDAYHQLILVHGLKEKVVVWRPSPDQTFGPDGKLTQDSVLGNPIKVLTIRDLADSCFPPADSAFTNSEIKQLSTWRRQSIRIRDAAIGKYLFDSDAFDEAEVEQLKNGEVGEHIALKGGALKDGADKVYTTTAQVHSTPDDQRGFQGIKQDINETLGIGSNQAGVETDTVRTATEAEKVASASQARNEKERARVIDFYLDVARAVDQLLMRYMDANEVVQVGGEEAMARLQVWNGKLIQGRYLYDIAPDSQLAPDNAQDFNLTLKYFNIVAMDPLVNRAYLHRRLARMRGFDPAKVIATANMQMIQPPMGGPSQAGGTVNQHQASNSGGKPNAPGAPNERKEGVH